MFDFVQLLLAYNKKFIKITICFRFFSHLRNKLYLLLSIKRNLTVIDYFENFYSFVINRYQLRLATCFMNFSGFKISLECLKTLLSQRIRINLLGWLSFFLSSNHASTWTTIVCIELQKKKKTGWSPSNTTYKKPKEKRKSNAKINGSLR